MLFHSRCAVIARVIALESTVIARLNARRRTGRYTAAAAQAGHSCDRARRGSDVGGKHARLSHGEQCGSACAAPAFEQPLTGEEERDLRGQKTSAAHAREVRRRLAHANAWTRTATHLLADYSCPDEPTQYHANFDPAAHERRPSSRVSARAEQVSQERSYRLAPITGRV